MDDAACWVTVISAACHSGIPIELFVVRVGCVSIAERGSGAVSSLCRLEPEQLAELLKQLCQVPNTRSPKQHDRSQPQGSHAGCLLLELMFLVHPTGATQKRSFDTKAGWRGLLLPQALSMAVRLACVAKTYVQTPGRAFRRSRSGMVGTASCQIRGHTHIAVQPMHAQTPSRLDKDSTTGQGAPQPCGYLFWSQNHEQHELVHMPCAMCRASSCILRFSWDAGC